MIFVSSTLEKNISKTKAKIDELKRDCSLFCNMNIDPKNREADVEACFAHEIQILPPPIFVHGKADIIICFENTLNAHTESPFCIRISSKKVIVHLTIKNNFLSISIHSALIQKIRI